MLVVSFEYCLLHLSKQPSSVLGTVLGGFGSGLNVSGLFGSAAIKETQNSVDNTAIFGRIFRMI